MKGKIVLIIVFCLGLRVASAQTVDVKDESEMKKRVVKMEFFSPLTGNLTFGYEQYISNFMSLEGKVGFIGLGIQNYGGEKEKGAFVKVGPKFKLTPDYITEATYGTKLLQGSYIRPEITFGSFSVHRNNFNEFDNTKYDDNTYFATIMLNYGHQYVLGKVMTLDWYAGVGYGYASEDDLGYYYANFMASKDFPIAFNAGLTIGFLLK